jgi:transcriptional regulator with XRE-family HTH domain
LSRIRDGFSFSLVWMHLYDRLLADYLRKKRGDETVRVYARKIGLTHGTLHRIENHQQSITIGKLGEIMDKLDCSWDDIFGKAKLLRRKPLSQVVVKPLARAKSATTKPEKMS